MYCPEMNLCDGQGIKTQVLTATKMHYLCAPKPPPPFKPLCERWMWVLHVHNNLSACCAHDGKTGTDESVQELVELKYCPSPCLDWELNPQYLHSPDHQCSVQTAEL